jgi:MFS family permease
MKNINWKAVMAGSATAIVLGVLSSFLLIFSPIISYGIYVGFIIGALLTGYIVGETCVDGAKNGILMGITTAIILSAVSIIYGLIVPREASSSAVIISEIYAIIETLIMCSIVGSIFGGIGAAGWKMKLNWKSVIVGFVVTFVIALLSGLYLPKMGLISPVIGAFIAVYLVEIKYRDGILYGGLSTSIAGLTSIPLVVFLSPNLTSIQMANFHTILGSLTYFLYIGSAISGFLLFLFIGIISGIIAVAVKKRTSNKFEYTMVVVGIFLVFILFNVVRVGAILSTYGPE